MLVDLQRLFIFPRFAVRGGAEPPSEGAGLERWTVSIDEGEVEAFFLPAPGASAETPGPAVLFAHGNAELIEQWPQAMEAYRALGISVLLPEYRGYGRSAGRPSEQAIVEDFIRFHDRLVARPEVDEARVFFHGRSIGTGVVCALARRRLPRALVLTSPFTSIAAMSRRFLFPPRFIVDRFDNERALSELDVPTLIYHGHRDRLIPKSHAERLAAIAKRARLVLCEADHNDCPPDWEVFLDHVRELLEEAGISESAGSPESALFAGSVDIKRL